jgi:4-hydroxybenzoyl-CoA thioesterase
MFVNRKRILVEFADCDPANIVFFANYFRWFDDCTTALFKAAGLPIRELFRSYGVVGIPVVEASARFMAPSTHGDEVEVESRVVELRNSSFVIAHKFFCGNELLMEGRETRVWAAAHPTEPNRLKALSLPKEVIEKLSGKKGGVSKRKSTAVPHGSARQTKQH